MNILHINADDVTGGAARAMYRLHKALLVGGNESRLLVACRTIDEPEVDSISRQVMPLRRFSDKVLDRVGRRLEKRFGLDNWSHRNSWLIPLTTAFREADVINLHNLHGGYFNMRALPEIASGKPLVWTLHDMNSFTGHCAFSYDCEMFISGCDHACPLPDAYPEMRPNRIKSGWLLRKRLLDEIPHLTAVSPSKWLAAQAKKGLWSNHHIEVIPNGINLETFTPLDRKKARDALGLESNGSYILLVAHNIKDPRKGVSLLLKALPEISISAVKLLTCGSGHVYEIEQDFPIPVIRFGAIQNERLMRLIYCAADVLAVPSLADNLPNTILESMACGTPVVAFDTGGLPEMVRHMETGYLAKYKDTNDFARGLRTLLSKDDLAEKLSNNCIEIAKKKYSAALMAERYSTLYQELARDLKKNQTAS